MNSFLYGQILTYVPDDNFEQELIDLGYDAALDNFVFTANISGITTLDIGSKSISDLTGIQNFVSLETLYVEYNNLTTLNISSLNNLETLRAYNNDLTTITTGNHPNLKSLEIHENNLASVDMSNMPVLETAYLRANNLSDVDVSNNPLLKTLSAQENNAALTSLDFSNNLLLEVLACGDGNLSSLDITQNPAIRTLLCNNALLTELDLRHLTNLSELQCMNNQLTFLNVKNGNNTLMNAYYSFRSSGNPNLTCIQVDNAAYAAATWTTYVDNTSTFGEHCYDVYVPDDAFEQRLIDLGYDTVLNDYLPYGQAETIISLNVNGLGIVDMTGLEAMVNITSLSCSNNDIATLDVSANTLLQTLGCYGNELTSLDLSANTQLTHLQAYGNNGITALDFSSNTLLEYFNIGGCSVTSLNLNNNLLLEDVRCQNNDIQTLDLSMLTNLKVLFCHNNELTELNVKNGYNTNITTFYSTGNPNLTCVLVDDENYSTTNWINRDSQTNFSEITCRLRLAPKAFLQGAGINPNGGEENLMRDDLRVGGYIPTTSPYADAAICDASVFNVTGGNAIVDWVWVELRDATDNTIVIDAQSALLQRDGDVVGVNGTSSLVFLQRAITYYIVINHRNHIGIMYSNVVGFGNGIISVVDYTINANASLGGNLAVVQLSNGKYAMHAGDYNGDEQILNTDVQSVLPLTGLPGYSSADADMNGQILNTDIQLIILPNTGKGQQF